jgi:hypothetical protein
MFPISSLLSPTVPKYVDNVYLLDVFRITAIRCTLSTYAFDLVTTNKAAVPGFRAETEHIAKVVAFRLSIKVVGRIIPSGLSLWVG